MENVLHSDFSLVCREYLWICFADLCILLQFISSVNTSNCTRAGHTIDELVSTRANIITNRVVGPEPPKPHPVALAKAVNVVVIGVFGPSVATTIFIIDLSHCGWSRNGEGTILRLYISVSKEFFPLMAVPLF